MTEDNGNQSKVDLNDLSYLSRRGLLRTGAVSLPALLAGCMGGDDEDGNGDGNGGNGNNSGNGGNGGNGDGDVPDERIDTRFVFPSHPQNDPIPQTNWNAYQPGSYPYGGYSFGMLTSVEFQIYEAQVDEEYMVLGESWEMADDTTVRQTFKEDIYWHDGTPITTKDIEVQERLNDAIVEAGGNPDLASPYVEGWDIVDEQTWELQLAKPFSEDFVKHELIQGNVWVKADIYESHAEEMEDLLDDGDTDGAEEALTNLLERNIPMEEAYGNGPFKYKDHDDTRLIFEAFDDYVYSDNIYFTELMWQDFGDLEEAFISGNLDGIKWSPEEQQVDRAPEFAFTDQLQTSTTGWHFNMGMFHLSESDAAEGVYEPITREPEGWLVRKALAYAINNEQVAMAYHDQAQPLNQPQSNYPIASYQEGSGPISPDWIDENLENYAPHQPEKARELLEEAGLTWDEDEEEWLDWDGEPFEIVMIDHPDPTHTQVVANNLENIGLNVNINASESFGSDRWEGEFELTMDVGAGTGLSVFDSFPKSAWQAGMYHGPGGDSDEPWQVPMPVGNTDVTDPSEREPFTQAPVMEEYLINGDEELLQQLLWSVNQFMPTAEMAYLPSTGSINTERWIVDGPQGLLNTRNGFYQILKHPDGTLAPREDSDYHPSN